MPTLSQVTEARLQEFTDLVRSGYTELTGKAIREGIGWGGKAEGAFVGRHKGLKPSFPELKHVPDSPGAIARAVERGKGKAYDRIFQAAARELSARYGYEDPAPRKKKGPGRPTEHPHTGRPYCKHCRVMHTKGQHRFHGAGSFHRTHLFSFGGNPMTIAEARRTFAELMQKSRGGSLTDAERQRLRQASQLIRYDKRSNPQRYKKATSGNPRKRRVYSRGNPPPPEKFKKYLEFLGYLPASLRPDLVAALYQRHMRDRKLREKYLAWEQGRGLFTGGSLFENPFPSRRRRSAPARKGARRNPGRQYGGFIGYVFGINAEGRQDQLISRPFASRADATKWIADAKIVARRTGFKVLQTRVDPFYGPTPTANPRGARRNPPGRAGLIRMGRLIEIRYQRDHGKQRGFYKHPFKERPTIYYDRRHNRIVIQG